MIDPPATPPVPRWLRVWAVLTALAALPLVTLGAEVTTKQVGMVDQVGFRAPWHLFTVAAEQLHLGYLIEHGHRLFGFVVGMCCIVLAIGMLLQARGGHRWLGLLALFAVSTQGILGIYRVNLNALFGSSLALIHGCFAQIVFATLVAVAVFSSQAWNRVTSTSDLARPALGLCVLTYTQIVFGAIVRHTLDPLAQRLHVLLAFAVVLYVVWLVSRLTEARRLGYWLLAMILVQPILGVEAWMRRFGAGQLPETVHSSWALDLTRSGHQVLGTLIFATTVALVVMLNKVPLRVRSLNRPETPPHNRGSEVANVMEGVA